MVPSGWELLELACKLLTYLGADSLLGSIFCFWLFKNKSRQISHEILTYLAAGVFLGFQGALLRFFVQVGMVVDNGLVGMFDWGMAKIYFDSPIGDTTFFQLCGFVLAFVFGIVARKKIEMGTSHSTHNSLQFFNFGSVVAFLLLILSFRFSGHISVLSTISKLAIVLHYSAFSAWIGSLYPLCLLSFSKDISFIRNRVKAFGDWAVFMGAVLIIAGGFMLLDLFGSIDEIFSTDYGMVVLVKLTLVIAILGIAAINRVRLTPNIVSQKGVRQFRNSVTIEIFVALLILIVTTYLSTVVGPPEH